ncbi:hypothetical protein Y032_0069g374 [Ancylostoma ceylanicum]|uniref:Uncharacterized protein n=1 Tax=Ancylostoma ceylanicum TaxID=53326 RepID=A0A016TZG8_9BILA|nr:hypothetical protein Y032_0069g374 [Ancylostoma ceylanicum]
MAPESLSSAVRVLFLGAVPNLVIFSLFSCFITSTSIMTTSDIDSSVRGAVARRACQGREWVTAFPMCTPSLAQFARFMKKSVRFAKSDV